VLIFDLNESGDLGGDSPCSPDQLVVTSAIVALAIGFASRRQRAAAGQLMQENDVSQLQASNGGGQEFQDAKFLTLPSLSNWPSASPRSDAASCRRQRARNARNLVDVSALHRRANEDYSGSALAGGTRTAPAPRSGTGAG